jgi:bifunctional non-homologous end joining protein LigD
MLSRRGNDWTPRFKRLTQALGKLPVHQAYLDGEVVALSPAGASCFGDLQATLAGDARVPLSYFAFDLIHLDGRDVSGLPIEKRKDLLRGILQTAPDVLRYTDHLVGSGRQFFEECAKLGLEGAVSKKSGSPYDPKKPDLWLKSKCRKAQEFVVVGFTLPSSPSEGFGGLILGVGNSLGGLVYAGGVGTGFDPASREGLKYALPRLAVKKSPLQAVPRDLERTPIGWVRPHLVAQVAFTNWTRVGVIRHGVFRGLRLDKNWQHVVRE